MPTIHLKSMKQCPRCFHLIPASAHHCPYCEGTGQPRPVQAIPVAQPWSASGDNIAAPTMMLPRDGSEGFVGKSSKTLLWVMIAAAVVVIGVVLSLIFTRDRDGNKAINFDDEYTEEVAVEEAYSPAEVFLGTYSGYLNGTIDITVRLTHADDRTISGSYYYGNGGYGSLDLEGYVSDDTLYLSETDNNGRQTGTWECTKYGDTLQGTMTNSNGRSFTVYLTQID